MRGVPGNATSHSFQHPSTVSALRADPPSPTRGEEKGANGRRPSARLRAAGRPAPPRRARRGSGDTARER
ncbi:MAG: hypothetical protein E5W93_16905 [Mesorhizobium sp.]|nr:MAG: hypothetical protein E5W93_16905 [Mesorhizobium sp.]